MRILGTQSKFKSGEMSLISRAAEFLQGIVFDGKALSGEAESRLENFLVTSLTKEISKLRNFWGDLPGNQNDQDAINALDYLESDVREALELMQNDEAIYAMPALSSNEKEALGRVRVSLREFHNLIQNQSPSPVRPPRPHNDNSLMISI